MPPAAVSRSTSPSRSGSRATSASRGLGRAMALALGQDRKLYYAVPQKEFDYGGSAGAGVSHLLTYDLNTGRKEDLGEMRLPDGRRVIGLNSADTGRDGAVYFVGAIEVREAPGQPAESAGRIGGVAYRLALVIYHPDRSGR